MGKFTCFGCLSGATAALAMLFSAPVAMADEEIDFSKGLFIINEDWYGHNNSTLNYLLPDAEGGDYWHYRVIEACNDNKQLGATAEAGEIWNGKFYIICKQPKDPGASIAGGRINVADASSMKIEYQLADIDPDGGNVDGRSFLGVDEHKGYVSSSNGVWVLDLDSSEIIGKITGTEEEGGSLYSGQSGSMVRSAGKVFVAHQKLGLLVVDPSEDKVADTISFDLVKEGAGIGSVVVAKDGSLWCSVASSTSGNGGTLPYLLRVDPETLATEIVDVPSSVYAPANSWYAWTPDGFCASAVNNSLYWNGGSSSWDSGSEIFKFDIDSRSFEKIIDLSEEGDGWSLYGCSMRVSPVSGELYMSLFQGYGSQAYIVRRYTADGMKLKDYPMIENYWFPSLPVFAQSSSQSGVEAVGVESGFDVEVAVASGSIRVINGLGNTITVYTMSGAMVMNEAVASDDYFVSAKLPAGIYVVKVGSASFKVRL